MTRQGMCGARCTHDSPFRQQETTDDPATQPSQGRCRRGGGRPHAQQLRPAGREPALPHLHGAHVQRLDDHAQALDGEGGKGIGRAHQVRGLPRHAARRHAAAALRPGTRRRGRHRLDAARVHARSLRARRGVRAAFHDDRGRRHLARLLGVHPDPGP